MECRRQGDMALEAASFHGPSLELLKRFNPQLECMGADVREWDRNQGSLNYRPPFEAAAGNYQFFADLLEQWYKDGWQSKEFNSRIYSGIVFASVVVAYHYCDDRKIKEVIREGIRTQLALWSLSTVRVPIKQCVITGPIDRGKTSASIPGVAHFYDGYSIVMVGDRQNVGYTTDCPCDVMLTGALGYRDRRHSRITYPSRVPKDRHEIDEWQKYSGIYAPLNIISNLAGDDYESDDWRDVFGLTNEEREILLKVTHNDIDAAKSCMRYISRVHIGNRRDLHSIRRTVSGNVECKISNVRSPHKPGHVYCSLNNYGEMRVLRPSIFKRMGATKSTATWDEREIVGRGDGVFKLPLLNEETSYSITFRGSNTPVLATDREVVTLPPTPTPPTAPPHVPSPPPTPKDDDDSDDGSSDGRRNIPWDGIRANHRHVSGPGLEPNQCKECYLGRRQHGEFAIEGAERSMRPGLVPRRVKDDVGKQPPDEWGVNALGVEI